MTRILILSDPHFEDDNFVLYRRNLCDKLTNAGRLVSVLLKQPFYFLKVLFSARNADIIFAPNFPSICRTALIISKLFKKKLIVKVVGDYAWETAVNKGQTHFLINDFQKSPKTRKIARLHHLQARLCKNAEAVIAPSDFLAHIVGGWGTDAVRIKVIREGNNLKIPDTAKEEARKKIGIAGNLLISAGQLVSWSGFRMLVKIMPQLLHINQFFRLVIIGDGPEYKILQAMIKNLNLDKKIYLVGRKNNEELAWYMAAANIFVLNTGHEGSSGMALEAMSAGVPVVTTAVGANLEIIKQGENGFMVKYNDEFNLVEAIKTVWQTPELRERFIEEGKKTVAYFSPENMVEETANLLNS